MKKIVSVLIIFLAVSACKKEELNSEPMQLLAIMKADFGSIPTSLLPDDWSNALIKSDWSKEKSGLYSRTVILDSVNVVINGKKFLTDKNGFLPAGLEIKKVSNVILDYSGDGSNMNFNPTRIQGRKIILENTIEEWFDAGDVIHEGHDHARLAGPGPMDDTRCLDYNGWFSNGVNYPKSNSLAYVNFLGSDCDFAMGMGFCYLDHLRGGCTKNNGIKCSAYLGHPLYFHVH